MGDMIRIRDVSERYGVSPRTLAYYEEAGLMRAGRIEGYAYRAYDEENVKRLEQILILRKLGIGVRDIRRVLESEGTRVVLEVLGAKARDIDEELGLLRELKEIVLEFIGRVEAADFKSEADVRALYDHARRLKVSVSGAEYSGNPSPANRLGAVSEGLERRAAERLSFPENILRRRLGNVYFLWGDSADAADELAGAYGAHVYHTCEHRARHAANADPSLQPGLFYFSEGDAGFFSREPADAMAGERAIVRDYTPMVIIDLIGLSAMHEKVICENDIDARLVLPYAAGAARIDDGGRGRENFLRIYASEVISRTGEGAERERLLAQIEAIRERFRLDDIIESRDLGVPRIARGEGDSAASIAEKVAELFGWGRA